MSRHPSQPLHAWVWLGLPMVVCVAATVAFSAPLRVFGWGLPEPMFALVLAFAWAMIRPSILGPAALLAMGLFYDLFWGGPLGLWGLSLLIAYFTILLARPLLAGQSVRVLWGWYIAACLLAFSCAYLFMQFQTGVTPNLTGAALQLAATACLYPAAHRLIDRFEDADVRFR